MILPGVSAPRRRSRFSLVYLVCRGARQKSGSGWTPNRAPTVREGLRHTHLLPGGGNPSLTVGAQIGVLPTLGFSRLAGIWPNPSHQCRAPLPLYRFSLLCVLCVAPSLAAQATAVDPSLAHKLSQLPLRFEPNRGQASRTARFVARAGGFTLSVNRADTVVSSGSGQVRIGFSGSNQTPRLTAEQPLEGRSNYLLGRKSSAWIKDVPGYGRVRQSGIYPGIDIVYYGKEGKLEYDFEVSAGADPRAIRMRFEGAERLAIDQDGNLAIDGPAGTLKQHRPVIYQKRVNGA